MLDRQGVPPDTVEIFEDDVDMWTFLIAMAVAFVIGGAVALLMKVNWLTGVRTSLFGPESHAAWYLSRSTGFVGFGLLWLSMALGLLITNKLARLWPGGPTAFDLHEYSSLLGLAFGCFHALILTADHYTNYTLRQVLVPFASVNYRPVWVGLGQLGLYLGIVVALTFYVRRFIGWRMWRLIHYASFIMFALVLLHGILSGTDSGAAWVRDLYWGSGASLVALTVYRVVAARLPALSVLTGR